MTFNETHYDFDEELERIRDEIADLEADINEADGPPVHKVEQLQSLGAQRKGLIWARDRAYENPDFAFWDEDVSGVTIGAVTAGVYGRVQDDVGNEPDAGEGTANTLVVAEATVDAPYIGDSDDATIAAVANCHPYYVQWAKDRVDDLLDPESGNGTSSGISPGDKPAETTQTGE